MENTMMLILFGFMAATLAVLMLGLVSMAAGEKISRRYGNKLMVARVSLQALALLMLGLLFLIK